MSQNPTLFPCFSPDIISFSHKMALIILWLTIPSYIYRQIKSRAGVNQMSLYLHKRKSIGLRSILRQIKSAIILFVIVTSYWLVKPDLITIYYILTALVIVVLLFDHHQPKKALANQRIKHVELGIIIIIDLFLAGIVIITGRTQSPLISVLLFPIILFTIEYGTLIGVFNFIGLTIFMIGIYMFGVKALTIKILVSPFIQLLTVGACLSMIGTLDYYQTHFNQKIDRLLTRDELTGLYNRRFLKFSVSKEIKAKKHFGFILIDINFFKYYNDFWGHSAGDSLLIAIGKILHKSVRPQDIVVRHSGDEFIVMLPESDQSTVNKTINKILQSIESYNFPGEECFPAHKLSISYGFTLFPGEAHHYQDLFKAADAALYSYKNGNINI